MALSIERTVSEKFYVTLSDEMAEELTYWAQYEGILPGTLASQIVMEKIREARTSGMFPRRDGRLSALIARISNGSQVSDADLSLMAHDMGLPLTTLKKIRGCLQE